MAPYVNTTDLLALALRSISPLNVIVLTLLLFNLVFRHCTYLTPPFLFPGMRQRNAIFDYFMRNLPSTYVAILRLPFGDALYYNIVIPNQQ